MGTLSQPRRVLITGASRGIGREAALLLARAGHRVVLAARDRAALEEVAGAIERVGGHAEVLEVDVTDDASVAGAIAALLAGGPCDVVVNNAGMCEQGEFVTRTAASLRAEMELNYWGALRVTRALLPSLVRRKSGLIVNVSSLLGSVAAPTTAHYGATRAALELWSFALRAELARVGVGVTVFVAPHTDTAQGRRVRFDGVVSLPVRYTARALVRAIDRAPRRAIASPVYRLLLWLGRLFPAFMEARVAAGTRALQRGDPLAAMAGIDASIGGA